MNKSAQAALLALLTAGLAGYLVCFPLMDTDIWWHLAAGRWIVGHVGVPHADPFAADTLGRAWVDVHWLFQLGVYVVYQAGGAFGLVLAKTVLVAAGVLLAMRSACKRLPRALWPVAAAIVLGFLFSARHLVLARPTVLTLLALTTTLALADRLRNDGRWRWSLALILVQIAWANVQGLYLLGPGLVGCIAAGDAVASWLGRRTTAIVLAPAAPPRALRIMALTVPAMIVAAMLTPYGPSGMILPFRLLGRISSAGDTVFAREVSENLAPWLLERVAPGELGAFKWLAALTFVSFLPMLRRGLDVGRLLICTAFFVLALFANRNVLLFVWLAGPIVAHALGQCFASTDWLARRWLRVAAVAGTALLATTLVFARAREARGEPPITQLAPFRVPVEAVERFLATPPEPGPVFCSDRYGGYLAWRLGPEYPPTMDGRLVLRSAQAYAEHLDLGQHPDRFEGYRAEHGILAALLPTAYPDRFLPLVLWLYQHPPWRLLYTDGTQTLFVYDANGSYADTGVDLMQPHIVRNIEAELAARYAATPLVLQQARLHLARLLAEVGASGPADAIVAEIPGTIAEALRARVAYRAGDRNRAEQLARRLLDREPNEAESLCLLALLAHDRGDRATAVSLLSRVLAADPFHPLARRLLDEMEAEPRR
jgi:hypothetical protein